MTYRGVDRQSADSSSQVQLSTPGHAVWGLASPSAAGDKRTAVSPIGFSLQILLSGCPGQMSVVSRIVSVPFSDDGDDEDDNDDDGDDDDDDE
ncbi:hypothetical protein ElyMa_006886500 [Elysia marginata]|uniref:Uncharacterized protein n=1 Tax=Elysia marginata TaxID=1093978 RepID=A0AAV4JDT5_9GAST|nr:hypothetical protein ElyMa_006886500 [Elysia marginata]